LVVSPTMPQLYLKRLRALFLCLGKTSPKMNSLVSAAAVAMRSATRSLTSVRLFVTRLGIRSLFQAVFGALHTLLNAQRASRGLGRTAEAWRQTLLYRIDRLERWLRWRLIWISAAWESTRKVRADLFTSMSIPTVDHLSGPIDARRSFQSRWAACQRFLREQTKSLSGKG